MPWWAGLYFVGYACLNALALVVLIREGESFGRIAVTLGAAGCLAIAAWAYWEPDAPWVRVFDLRRLYLVGIVLTLVDAIFSLYEEWQSAEDMDLRTYGFVMALVLAGVLVLMAPALWWGYRAAFG